MLLFQKVFEKLDQLCVRYQLTGFRQNRRPRGWGWSHHVEISFVDIRPIMILANDRHVVVRVSGERAFLCNNSDDLDALVARLISENHPRADVVESTLLN